MRIPSVGEADLLIALHQGNFEQPLWSSFLERLLAQTGASYTAILFRPLKPEGMIELSAGTPLPPQFQRTFLERFQHDPLPYRTMRTGRIYSIQELLDPADPDQQSFYNDLLVPGGMGHSRMVRITEPSGADAWLAVVGDREFGAAVGALMSRLVPHFTIALQSFIALEKERFRALIASETLGRMNFGWLSIDAQCRVLDMTPNITSILQRTKLLQIGRSNRLMPASPGVYRDLTTLIGQFVAQSESRPKAINLSRDPWMDMLVAPVKGHSVAASPKPVAIIYLRGDVVAQSDRREQLIDLFGLLPSEARLAWAITQGFSIAEAAEVLGITPETARGYSKQIYAKTGARGQAELVRIILTSVLALT